MSLRQISEVTGEAKTTIRKVLVSNKVVLRSNRNTQKDGLVKPRQALFGGILYGYCALDGKLVIDPKEIKIVRKIFIQHQQGMSFNAISRWLNNQNIPSKKGKLWSDVSVASVIRKHLIIKSEETKNG